MSYTWMIDGHATVLACCAPDREVRPYDKPWEGLNFDPNGTEELQNLQVEGGRSERALPTDELGAL